ncbi:hypothetical protein QUW15_14140, partial [Desulfovibrio piger]|nr:hypothetical protein [Desulfovibrio piger]
MKKVKREAAAQRRPAQSERKKRVFSAKRQTVWLNVFQTENALKVSNRTKCRLPEIISACLTGGRLPVG